MAGRGNLILYRVSLTFSLAAATRWVAELTKDFPPNQSLVRLTSQLSPKPLIQLFTRLTLPCQSRTDPTL